VRSPSPSDFEMDQASGETCSLKSRRSAYVSSRHSGEWSVSRDGKSVEEICVNKVQQREKDTRVKESG